MFQHHSFNSHSRSRNELAPQHSGQETQEKTASATQPVAAATPNATLLKLCQEERTVFLLMGFECHKLGDHGRCGQARGQDLARVDIDGTMFTGVVHPQYSASERNVPANAFSHFLAQTGC